MCIVREGKNYYTSHRCAIIFSTTCLFATLFFSLFSLRLSGTPPAIPARNAPFYPFTYQFHFQDYICDGVGRAIFEEYQLYYHLSFDHTCTSFLSIISHSPSSAYWLCTDKVPWYTRVNVGDVLFYHIYLIFTNSLKVTIYRLIIFLLSMGFSSTANLMLPYLVLPALSFFEHVKLPPHNLQLPSAVAHNYLYPLRCGLDEGNCWEVPSPTY